MFRFCPSSSVTSKIRQIGLVVATVGGLLASGPSVAAIVGGAVTGGDILSAGSVFEEVIASSGVVVGRNSVNEINLFGMVERQDASASDITVEIGATIAAGTAVQSYLIFYDPPQEHLSQVGYVDFDKPVSAIATSDESLSATSAFRAPGVIYQTQTFRGLEEWDSVWIDPDNPYRIWVNWNASQPGDHIRVLTAVPLPAPAMLLGGGLLALVVGRRRRR